MGLSTARSIGPASFLALMLGCGDGDGLATSFGVAGTHDGSQGSDEGLAGSGESGSSSDAASGGDAESGPPCDCDDGIACTVDSCDAQLGCRHEPDDAQCADADPCNGHESCDAQLGCQTGTPVVCADDEDACTLASCDPATGACVAQPLGACVSGDGCCPAGCMPGADDDCACTNVAPAATPSQSDGGGTGAYGPAAWIDGVQEHDCVPGCVDCYGWVDNPEGSQQLTEYMQLEWAVPQTIGSMYVATSDALLTPCAQPGYPRNIAQGDVQVWDGLDWLTVASFAGEDDDVLIELNPPVETIAVRIDGIRATPSLNPQIAPPGSSIVFEWYVYEPTGCYPELPPS